MKLYQFLILCIVALVGIAAYEGKPPLPYGAPTINQTMVNASTNIDVDFGDGVCIVVIKPWASLASNFTISGLAKGYNGRVIVIYNSTTFNMILTHEGGNATAVNRLKSNTGSDITCTGNGTVILFYDSDAQRWIDLGLRG